MNKVGDASSENGKYGAKRGHDPSFAGPIKNRSCTDVICCILFVLFTVGMVAVGVIAFMWGDPKKILYPTDSLGNMCGYGNYKSKPNLFFFDLMECVPKNFDPFNPTAVIGQKCPTTQICVSSCPQTNEFFNPITSNKSQMYCKYSADRTQSISTLLSSKQCASYVLSSEALLGRCIPTLIGDKVKDFFNSQGSGLTNNEGKNATQDDIKWATIAQAALENLKNLGERILADVQAVQWWLLAGMGIAMLGCLIYIILMRWLAGILVWLTTYAVLTLIGFGVYYCWTQYKQLAALDNSDLNFSKDQFTTNLSSMKEKKETWMAGGIILACLLLILVLLLLAIRKRIALAVQLIKEGSKAITSMMSTLFFPIIPFILQLILFVWFVVVLLFLATSGKPVFSETTQENVTVNGTSSIKARISSTLCDAVSAINDASQTVSGQVSQYTNASQPNLTISTCSFDKYQTDDNVLRLQVFHIFGWFWLLNFIIAFGQCVLAGAFASWYWAWDKKKDVPTLPLIYSMGRTLRYHTGSLAFGSLIIAIIQIIRVMLEYVEYKLKAGGREPTELQKFFLKCMKCCFWCLEKFMKFLNKNAYIEIAVYGKNFCTSAKNAFFLLMRNIVRVAVLDKVTDFLLFIGKLSVTAAMGVGSFYFFESQTSLNYYLTPIIILVIGTWCVASAFFGVYEMAIDTLFLSFLEDSERHDGTPEKPYYMSPQLLKILGKKNKDDGDEEKA